MRDPSEYPRSDKPLSEVDVETSGISDYLTHRGFVLKSRKSGIVELDAAWPTKKKGGTGAGQPDLLLHLHPARYPVAVWENKSTDTGVDVALAEAQGYVEGVHRLLRGKPNLPRVAVGYDGVYLKASYLTSDSRWVALRDRGNVIVDAFPTAEDFSRGIRNDGSLVEPPESLDARVLRGVFEQLKSLYRSIPTLKSGRRPIDFTVALLTLRLVVEREEWGSWSEQPSLVPDAVDLDQQVAERFIQLVSRCMNNATLRDSYGSIFKFREQDENDSEVAFDFEAILKNIPTGKNFFRKMFELLDSLPLLHGADIDIFGEVYQAIGDDAVKKAFGEYFTGRHIIAGVVPLLMERASVQSFEDSLRGRSIADIACGTGGFLTETLRYVRRGFGLNEDQASAFAEESFFGYDLSASNASRARVNMYFAGDGFSVIQGGADSLDAKAKRGPGKRKFDFILTNPPYGSSSQHHLLHEAFLSRVLELLKPTTGWGLVVMPTGTLENPRSSAARLNLLRDAQVTDVISLPKHAFAPYTTQRTGIVVFRKRPVPLSATTWTDLLKAVGHEKVALFEVKHDGFANSDKRFATKRRAADNSWEHDDLSPWLDLAGNLRASKLMRAVISESGETGSYVRMSLDEMDAAMKARGADRGSGVELLPDNFLAPSTTGLPPADFVERTKALSSRLRGDLDKLSEGASVSEELATLMSAPIALEPSASSEETLDQILSVTKGNPNLTEAAIYAAHDADGIPVYGGGVAPAVHRIRRDAKTSKGRPVTVFEGPAIVLSVDGSSGAMQVIESGEFACNHHAAVLKPLTEGLNLHLVAQQAEARLKALASNKSGSATLTLGTINSLLLRVPTDPAVIDSVGRARAALTAIRRALG